jgi:hypothetical protein
VDHHVNSTRTCDVHDHARFGAEDAWPTIAAAFACRYCLRAADLVIIRERLAISQCSHCNSVTRVAITEDQARFVWQLPRSRPFIHFAVHP